MIRLGSIFTGIGGLDKGVEDALRDLGFVVEVVFQVERDAFCRAVLEKHWPAVNRTITDVRFATARSLPSADGLIGGFPCQDISGAGDGAGLGTEDNPTERSGLWFQFRRLISELRPAFVVVENVASGVRRWLCQVRTDLHALGYRTRAIQVSAADVGLPIFASESSSSPWPTPSVCGNYNRKGASPTSGDGLETAVRSCPTPTARDWKDGANPSLKVPTNGLLGRAVPRDPTTETRGALNPEWVEALMGFPAGWTSFNGPLPAEQSNASGNRRARSKGGK